MFKARHMFMVIALFVTPFAHAHPGHEHDRGLVTGLLHTFSSVDHFPFLLGGGLLIVLVAGIVYLGARVRRSDFGNYFHR